MSRILENRVAKLEDRRRGQGRFDDWTDEQLDQRIAELDAIITDNGRLRFEDVVAGWDDVSEAERSRIIELHRKYPPEYSRKI